MRLLSVQDRTGSKLNIELAMEPPLEGQSTTPSPAPQNAEEPKSTNGSSKRPDKTLPTPRLKVSQQLDILRAFVVACETEGAAVTNDQVGRIIKMSGTTVVLSNPFLCEIGLLRRISSGTFDVSDIAKAYKIAHDWKADTAGLKLAPALEDKWFAKALIPRLKMREWSKLECAQVLAEAAGATKEYETNVLRLLEFMDAAKLIDITGDAVKLGEAAGTSQAGASGAIEKEKTPPPTPLQAEAPEGDICFLDRKRTRKVIVHAPLDISNDEVDRLKAWIDLMYFVKDDKLAPGSPATSEAT